jgi:hypothetical protein
MTRTGHVISVVIGILLFGLVAWALIFGDGDRDAKGKSVAQVMCKNAVRVASRFPSMAHFGGTIDVADDDARYLVGGSVRLMNESGAMVSHAFVCGFHKRSRRITLLSLTEQRAD